MRTTASDDVLGSDSVYSLKPLACHSEELRNKGALQATNQAYNTLTFSYL
jgi:hypothetical protein